MPVLRTSLLSSSAVPENAPTKTRNVWNVLPETWTPFKWKTAWEKEGLPVKLGNAPFPLFRQIQIGAGVLVLSGILGSYVWHHMYWLSAFVGAGLIFAGITGFCGLGILLSRMPWNRR